MSDPHAQTAEPVNPDVHHERADVDIRGILWFIGFLVVFAIFTHVALYFHFIGLREANRDPDRLPISLVEGEEPNLPPEPRLQPFPSPGADGRARSPLAGTPPYDMDAMRRREERELSTYGWLNKANGTVRIPIERAMELQLQRGYPVLETTTAPAPAELPDRAQPAQPTTETPSR